MTEDESEGTIVYDMKILREMGSVNYDPVIN